MSTVAKGNELRDKIFDLLFGLGKTNCKKEFLVGGKKADVYYEERDQFGDTIRCVVECKNYAHHLTNHEIKSILVEYKAESDHFDKLFILTHLANDLSSQMQQTLQSHKYAKLFTYVEFHSTVIDFRKYLYSSRLKFKEDGLDQYYVELLDTGGTELSSKIDAWIDSDSFTPRAILAEYGMGKTCFALKLVERYSQFFLEGGTGRIPIYIRLGDIVDKTNIESVICTMFSSTYPIGNFTYPIFKEMNRQGHLIIIYDGFDEMKHAMTAGVFRSMFIDLNSLIEGKSKVLLLGRPNAFLSDKEQASLLNGVDYIDGVKVKDPNMADYETLKIQPFNRLQLEYFLRNYLEYLKSFDPSIPQDIKDKNHEFLENRLSELLGDSYKELIDRPVHARMIARLALSTDQSLAIYKRFHLYGRFIQMFFDREMAKTARESTDRDTRLAFAQDIAWKLWKDNGRRHFSSKELSGWEKDYFDKSDLNRNVDLLRELLIGSILERKQSDYYYFSHRSFQEYLVALFLLSKESFIESDIGDMSNSINDEILSFIEEGDSSQFFGEKLLHAIKYYNGHLSNRLIDFLVRTKSPENNQIVEDIFDASPWYTFIHTLAAEPKHVTALLGTSLEQADEKTAVNHLACILALIYKHAEAGTLTSLPTSVCSHIHLMCISEIMRLQINKGRIVASIAADSKGLRNSFTFLVGAFKPIVESQSVESRSLTCSFSSMSSSLHEILETTMKFDSEFKSMLLRIQPGEIAVAIEDMRPRIEKLISAQILRGKDKIDQSDRNAFDENVRSHLRKIRQFWGSKPTIADLVPVSKLKENVRPKLTIKKS